MGIIHYDVKLLNYLVHVTNLPPLHFSLPWGQYCLPTVAGSRCTLELSDFGTAEKDCAGGITVGQVGVGGKSEA